MRRAVCCVVLAAALAGGPAAQAAHMKPEQVVRAFVRAINTHDVDRVMSYWASNATLIDAPRCTPCRGTRALRRVETEDAADRLRVLVAGLDADGNTVTGRFTAWSDSIREAGVLRVKGTFTARVAGDRLTFLKVLPDLKDKQTAKLAGMS